MSAINLLFRFLAYSLKDMFGYVGYADELLDVGSVVLGGPYHRLILEVGDDVLVTPCAEAEVVGA